MAAFTKCACPHCGGQIEFPTHGTDRVVECPHCTIPVELSGQRRRSWLWNLLLGATCLAILVWLMTLILPQLLGQPVLHKGQVFQNWNASIKIVSSDELEISTKDQVVRGRYRIEGGKIRVVMTILGTDEVLYCKMTENGIEDDHFNIYYTPPKYEAMMRRVEVSLAKDKLNELKDALYKGTTIEKLSTLRADVSRYFKTFQHPFDRPNYHKVEAWLDLVITPDGKLLEKQIGRSLVEEESSEPVMRRIAITNTYFATLKVLESFRAE